MADKDKLTYWERRAVWLEQQSHDKGNKYVDALIKAYMQAQQYLIKQTQQIYTRYLSKSELSEAEVARILNTKVTPEQLAELSQLVKTTKNKAVKKQLQTYLDGLAVKHRITQLELLRAKSYVVAKQLANVQLSESEPYYIEVMQDAYNRASAESIIGQTQKDFNVYQGDTVPEFSSSHEQIQFVDPKSDKVLHTIKVASDKPITRFKELSTNYVKQALNGAWEGKSYSKRIWNNTDEFASRLRELFTAKQLSGMSERAMAETLIREFSVSAYQARRLVRTESAYFSNQARLHAWKQHDVKEYSLLAVLDFRTSKICRRMDGKIFKVVDARVDGEDGTYPPFHPFCRTVAVAHFTNTMHGGYRTARDPIADKAIKIPKDATYRDWEKLLVNKHGKGEVDLMQFKINHYSSDLKQYRKLQSDLSNDNVPVSFDNFQNMKYRNSEDWHELNLYKEERVSGALSAQMSFKDYRSLHELANETLVGVQTSDGIVIRSLSKHFMSRLIGSSTLPPLKSNGVRDKIRTGVHLDGIKDALLHGSVESSRYDKTVRVYSGKDTRVTLNIETGNIVQTNPHHPRRKK